MKRVAILVFCCVWNPALADDSYVLPEPISAESCAVNEEDWAQKAVERSQSVHLGLPALGNPKDNPVTAAKVRLGRKLFADRRLSINGTMSCAMCHVPEQGFANWELSTAVGVEGRSVKRNSPTLINVGFLDVLFHDGRDPSLETQFVGPLVARNEMANPSIGVVVALLQNLPEYQGMFETAFGARASLDRIGKAFGAYQRTLIAGNAPFDRWYFGDEASAISDAAKRGFDVFQNKGDCASCHVIEQQHALFTDQQFHNTGYGQMREDRRQNPPSTVKVQVAPGVVHDVDFGKVAAVSAPQEVDLGRYEVTEDPKDRWQFRTPSLRNLTVTAPYMHDGFLSSLSDVVEFYDQGGPQTEEQDPRVRPLSLTDSEKQDLIAFLESLTSPDLGCLVGEARIHPPDNIESTAK
ncbi:cytochrome-c peroxidase [Cohaesibacter gelatinilyticus]|uniref:Methylamine utilization protein MauG n=1 Tax=Cohaesibacter gelatinilyticus TaxID=372072 RepID=A0A285PC33_9HYPH|nr:cytochrome c peroxidase [Cohaesibacter gelatinilyticus]SNZ19292.1 cytochrome c peroxidase [Cohaesibacter gelatinilyticus]